jgi:hypothetical protein
MQMIVEINHPLFEALSGGEQPVLASGHFCDCFGDVFFQRIPGHQQGTDYVRRGVPIRLVPVEASLSIQHLRQRWRERKRIHYRVAVPDRGNHVIGLGNMTAVVAVLAHQQQHPLAFRRFLFKQVN